MYIHAYVILISTPSTSPQLQMQLQLDYDEFILDGYKKNDAREMCKWTLQTWNWKNSVSDDAYMQSYKLLKLYLLSIDNMRSGSLGFIDTWSVVECNETKTSGAASWWISSYGYIENFSKLPVVGPQGVFSCTRW